MEWRRKDLVRQWIYPLRAQDYFRLRAKIKERGRKGLCANVLIYITQNHFRFGAPCVRAAATNALSHGADIAKVQEWLGRANFSTTRLYNRGKIRPEDSSTLGVRYWGNRVLNERAEDPAG
jgi:hypothetical protein